MEGRASLMGRRIGVVTARVNSRPERASCCFDGETGGILKYVWMFYTG